MHFFPNIYSYCFERCFYFVLARESAVSESIRPKLITCFYSNFGI